VDRVRDQLGNIPDTSFEKFESPDLHVRMEAFHKGGKNGIPRATAVLDADIVVCAATDFQFNTRKKINDFYGGAGLERAQTTHNEHSYTCQLVQDLAIPTISLREFVSKVLWRWESETVLVVVTESCLSERYPIRKGYVRGTVKILERFEKLAPRGRVPQTRVTWIQQPDLGGLIPSAAVRGAAIGQMM
jgi:hypothetical protein